jgi:hypothetical protein
LRLLVIIFLLQRFFNAIAFLADLIPVTAMPQRVNYWVLVLGVTGGAEDFGWVIV